MATALYRRYRPEAFSEMIGQAHVTEPLMTALRTGRVGHAYLFSGPRGCGKTTSARILARCLNCAEGPTDTPCGSCPSCLELSRDGGGSLDVVEIDAASHGGVDDARELRERAVFAPARDRYKIFIIDEAHMVTAGGFNALLKIVEEPPPHVKFIFATTEPEKVIGTIRSRTHHYPFRLIAPAALIEYVQQLCESEGVGVETGVLPLIVRAGGGSVRDTLSILDQLLAGSEDGRVSLDRATGLLGFTSSELIDDTVASLSAGDTAAAFAATDRVVQTGQDPRRFVEDLLERLRDLIVISATTVQGASAVFRGVPEDQLQRMFEQSQGFAPGQLSRIADTVADALDSMAGATAPRLQLELMMARALREQLSHAPTPPAQREMTSEPPQRPAPVQATAPTAMAAAPEPPGVTSEPPAAAPDVTESAPAPSPEPAVDVIATLRSAREFLNADSAGAGRPPMVPLGGEAPGRPDADVLPPDAAAAPPEIATPGEPVRPSSLTFEELVETWPSLLEELLEADREAWNAVRNVQPLALEAEMLTIGLASKSDLNVFKVAGAGPLREVIEAAFGISVKYVPKALPAGAQPPMAAARESAPPPQEPSPAGDTTPATGAAESAARAVPVATPTDDFEPAPPPSEFDDPSFDPGSDSDDDPQYDGSLSGGANIARPDEAQEGSRSGVSSAMPSFTRYGEAVVREVLGARFIEERPLPDGFER